MRYLQLVACPVTIQGGAPQTFTTASVVRHFLDTEARFTTAGPGIRHAIAIDSALADAEAAGAAYVALEDAPFEALAAAVEKPEKGYPDVCAFNRETGEIVQRFSVVRQLGPIMLAIMDAPKTKPADFDAAPAAPALPPSIAAER